MLRIVRAQSQSSSAAPLAEAPLWHGVTRRKSAAAYAGIRRSHALVKHSVKEFVNEMAHTNGIESVWAVMKRGYSGVYHHWSAKHLTRYINEFTFRLGKGNVRRTTMQRLDSLVRGAMGKRLTYATLIGPEYTRNPRML